MLKKHDTPYFYFSILLLLLICFTSSLFQNLSCSNYFFSTPVQSVLVVLSDTETKNESEESKPEKTESEEEHLEACLEILFKDKQVASVLLNNCCIDYLLIMYKDVANILDTPPPKVY